MDKMGLELWGDRVSERLVTNTLTVIVASGTLLFSHHLRIWLSLYSFWSPSPPMNSSVHTPPALGQPSSAVVSGRVSAGCSPSLVPCGRFHADGREASQSRGGLTEPLLRSLLPEPAIPFTGCHTCFCSSRLPEQPERRGPAYGPPAAHT